MLSVAYMSVDVGFEFRYESSCPSGSTRAIHSGRRSRGMPIYGFYASSQSQTELAKSEQNLLGVLYKKCILGSYDQEFGSEMRLREILELSACTSIGIVSFGFDPGFEQWPPAAAQSIFQIEKTHSGSL